MGSFQTSFKLNEIDIQKGGVNGIQTAKRHNECLCESCAGRLRVRSSKGGWTPGQRARADGAQLQDLLRPVREPAHHRIHVLGPLPGRAGWDRRERTGVPPRQTNRGKLK